MKKIAHELLRLIIFLIYLAGITFLFISLTRDKDGIQMLETITPVTIQGTICIDGGPQQEFTDTAWDNESIDSLVVTGTISHDITSESALIIWPRNLRVTLYVNEVEVISTGQQENFPSFIKYAGNSFQILDVGTISSEDTIRLVIEKVYSSCNNVVLDNFFENIYVGRIGIVYLSIMINEMMHPLIGIAIMLIGFLILFCSVLLNFNQSQSIRQIYYLGFFCLLGGISYLYDSAYEFIDLLIPFPVINTLIDLYCIPLLVFFYLKFITDAVPHHRTKQFMRWIISIFSATELIMLCIQLGGIYDVHEMQDILPFMGGYAASLGCLTIIYEIVHNKIREMKKVLFAVLPFTSCLLPKTINQMLEQGINRTYLRIGILFTCVLLLHYSFQYAKKSIRLLEQGQQMQLEMQNAQVAIMLSQIHPHFLYNALNTLQHICLKDGDLAAEAIGHFSKYLRGNMDSLTNKHPIPFTQELEHVKHYLYIQQLRFGDRIRINYDLRVTNFYIPTLTLQPIVENAIRHGITKQAEGGIVIIATRQLADEIWIIITDTGVGFETTYINNENDTRSHVGIQNVRKRLKLQCNATLEIISTIGIGTQVTIRMKGTGLKHENYGR